MKKIIVVGAGIAGLSAGIYAQKSGFDVTIYESHSIPGGASTSWKRNGYFFEGGIHWMIGTSEKHPHHKIWKEVGALNDDVKIHYKDPFLTVDYKGDRGYLYRDIEKLRQHFIDISPEDKNEIEQLCKDIQLLTKERMYFYAQYTAKEYAQRFKSKIIRTLLENTIGPDYCAIAMIINLITITSGDGGYPEGGSIAMANRMATYFKSLGGKINYNSKVTKVSVNGGVCDGVIVEGNHLEADSVIVTLDTLVAIDKLFDNKIEDLWAEKMRKSTKPMLNTFICLGIKTDLSNLPESIDIITDKKLVCGGIELSHISVYNYSGYEGYAPDGCSVITSIIPGDSYDYWKACMDNGTYVDEKNKLAKEYIELLTERFPEIKGKIEVCDVATPLTYERYTGSYKGSWMSIVGKNEQIKNYPCKPENIKNIYFASQRLNPPGGLSGASESGKIAVKHLCEDNEKSFDF